MSNIAIFASGSGSNFEAIVTAAQEGRLRTNPAVMVCDKPGAYVIERATKHGIPSIVFNPRDFENKAAYERYLVQQLEPYNIDLVCLAGYMRLIGPTFLAEYQDRIINIHPSLLPAFKGAHAIKDAFEYGVKVYGVTIHYVDETLDGGKIISQSAFNYNGEDMEELETMIHSVEHKLYPETINLLLKD